MSGWQLPSGPLNVWAVVDGYETLKDGTKKRVKFSIQDIPNDEERKKEVLDLMHTYFLVDEPLSKSVDMKNDPEGAEGFELIWKLSLEQGVTIGCYKLDDNGKIDKLVGANMVFISTPQDRLKIDELKKLFKSKTFVKIWNFFENLAKEGDVKKIYNVDSYISSISLSVLPEYRGQKLGYHILLARDAMGKKYGISATSTMFTAHASQLQAKRAGFVEVCSKDYAEARDEDGNLLFPNIDAKCAKIMMKKFF